MPDKTKLQQLATEEKLRELNLKLALSRKDAEERLKEAEGLLEGLQALTGAMVIEHAFAGMLDVLRGLLDFEAAFILKSPVDGEGQLDVIHTTDPTFDSAIWNSKSYFQRVLSGKTLATFNVQLIPEWNEQPKSLRERAVSALHVPLPTTGQRAMLVCTHSERGFFGKKRIDLAKRFSPLAAQALYNAELRAELKDERDGLEIRVGERTAELAQQRNFALQVMNTMGQGLTVTNSDMCFEYVNPAYAEMVGYSPDELIGKSPYDVTLENDHGHLSDAFVRRTLGSSGSYETMLKHADGHVIPVLITAVPRKQGDEVIGAIAVITDLTERKRMEGALLQSEAKYRSIFENVQDVFYQTDGQGIITEISPSVKSYIGLPRIELIGRNVGEFYSDPGDYTALVSEMEKNGRVEDYEIRMRGKDDAILYTSVTAQLIFGEAGSLIRTEGVLRDITDRKQMEFSIRESEARYRELFEALADGIAVTDDEGIVQYANQAFYTITGFEDEEIGGNSIARLLPFEKGEFAPLLTHLKETLSEEKIWRGEATVRRSSGEVYDADLTITSFQYRENTPTGYVVSVRDITAMKELERMKSRFVSTVSHELRTPLSIINLYTENLIEFYNDLDDQQRKDLLTNVQEEASSLQGLIEDVLLLSRFDAGRDLLNQTQFDLCELLHEATSRTEPLTDERGIRLQNTFTESPVRILGDKDQLRQVFRNLITNAVKFTLDGGEIEIYTKQHDGSVIVSVTDTGIGIPEEEIPHVFERFFRGNHPSQHEIPGTGLGLSIAKELVDRHGGSIELDSEVGKGSTFRVILPTNTEDEE